MCIRDRHNNNNTNNRKCVVFLKNYADFLENDTSVDLIGEHIESSPENSQIPPTGGRKTKSTKKSEDSELELSDDEMDGDNIPQPGEYDTAPIKNNLPFISMSMFMDNGEPIYCVKTESIFMEL